jgi:AcrR family transcriptional regulator
VTTGRAMPSFPEHPVPGSVVRVAAARLRVAGLNGPGIAEIMEVAGLTRGGFYRHFASRDELVAEAVEHMKDQFAQHLPVVAGQGLARLVDDYLSVAHRDTPATGCAVVAIDGLHRSEQLRHERLAVTTVRCCATAVHSGLPGCVESARPGEPRNAGRPKRCAAGDAGCLVRFREARAQRRRVVSRCKRDNFWGLRTE